MGGDRCFESIGRRDLKRLATIVRRSREDLLRLQAAWGVLYGRRFLCSVLAGPAADHVLNGVSGFRVFDVWTFFAAHPDAPFPAHRRFREDYGTSRFGRDPALPETFAGRAIDWCGRSIDAAAGEDPLAALGRYLRARPTPTSRQLAAQTLLVIEPADRLGTQAWPALFPA